ncbi:phage structural protein [Aureimonas ureilytica]|uniref:phage structural protein n=1 Tax=Aureimonas ureilytica TaxID=401562 RepID=UPI000361A448|nr:phage protein [Aureimonas ureilytica]
MAKSSVYSFLQTTVTVDGRKADGFWDGDDSISVTEGADIGTGLVGADGSSIFSQSADRSATIALRLQHTSPVHALLMRKLARQREGVIEGFPVTIIDRGSGEGGATDQAFIQQAPEVQKGTAATVREWQLWTGDWRAEIPTA